AALRRFRPAARKSERPAHPTFRRWYNPCVFGSRTRPPSFRSGRNHRGQMRLAFLDLPDDQVDLISTARQSRDVELVLVAHADPEALALKIAEVLQIPRSTEPLDLLQLKPDRVALPSMGSEAANALIKAGISPRIFTPLDDLAKLLANGTPPDEPDPPTPIEEWEANFEEATGTGSRLSEIRDAMVLSDDRQRLFKEILALAVEEAGADAGSLMVVDPDEAELRIAFAEGLSPDTVRTVRQKIGEGVAGMVALDGKPLIINDKIDDPRFKEGRERARIAAAMSAPIQLDGRVIGVLNVSSDRPGKRFADQDLARLTELSGQVSAILDRVVRRTRRDEDAIEFRARQILEAGFQDPETPVVERLRLIATRLAEHLQAAGALEATPNLVMAPLQGTRVHGVLTIECVTRVETDLEGFTRLLSRLGRYL